MMTNGTAMHVMKRDLKTCDNAQHVKNGSMNNVWVLRKKMLILSAQCAIKLPKIIKTNHDLINYVTRFILKLFKAKATS